MKCDDFKNFVTDDLPEHQFQRMEYLCLSSDVDAVASGQGKRNQFDFNEIPESNSELTITLLSR